MSSSSLPLPQNPSFPLKPHPLLHPSSTFPVILKPSSFSHPLYFKKSLICHAFSPSDSDPEESRWLREEQRWLREEQRWLREEQRWARERELLLREISDLKLQIQSLERRISVQDISSSSSSVTDTIANITALLQVLMDKNNLIAESGSISRPIVLEEKRDEQAQKEVVVEKIVRALGEGEVKLEERKTLRKGSEGDEVRAMQVCFQ